MKTFLCIAGCVGSFSHVIAQSFHHAYGPFFTGYMAYSVHQNTPFAFLSNTASLAQCTKVGAGLMAENKFGLRELNSYCATVQAPFAGGAAALVADWAGSAALNQSQLSLACARSLGAVNLGIRFNYYMVRMDGYGNDGAISFEIGSTWHITEKLCTGLQVSNPIGKLSAVYSMGMGYECNEQFFISAVFSKEENKTSNLQMALQYTPAERLLTMVGFNSSMASPSFAAGWSWQNMQVMVSGSFHPQLGASTGIVIIFYGKKKDE